MQNPNTIYPAAIPQNTTHAPAANTAAQVVLAAAAGTRHVVRRLAWSYDAAPTAGQITVAYGSATHVYYITAAGPGFLPVDIVAAENQAVTVTLAAAGASVKGALIVTHH